MTPPPDICRPQSAFGKGLCRMLLLLALAASHAIASTVVQRPFDELVRTSQLVFEGQVTRVESEQSGKRIHTWVTLEVLEVVKGSYGGQSIRLRYLGGSVGDQTLMVGDMRLPAFGERGIYLVESLNQPTVHPLRGWGQGHFILRADAPAGKRRVYNSQGRAVIGLTPTPPAKLTRFDADSAAGVQLASKADDKDSGTPAMDSAAFKAYIRRVGTP